MATIDIDISGEQKLLFDEDNANWEPQPEYNLAFIRSVAQYMQQRLAVRDYLFVNEVRDALGFDWTPEGQVCGWRRRDGYINIQVQQIDNNAFRISFEHQGVIVNSL